MDEDRKGTLSSTALEKDGINVKEIAPCELTSPQPSPQDPCSSTPLHPASSRTAGSLLVSPHPPFYKPAGDILMNLNTREPKRPDDTDITDEGFQRLIRSFFSNEHQLSSISAKNLIDSVYDGVPYSNADVDHLPQPYLGATSNQKNDKEPITRWATSDYEDKFHYKMSYPERGCFIIFNQYKFDFYNENNNKNRLLNVREGTKEDALKLEKTFKRLGFEYVKVIDDATKQEIIQWIEWLSHANHSNYDCFGCAILTHGGDRDILYARDAEMNLTDFTRPFGADLCPSLAGKPKLFFIQACRGMEFDYGATVKMTQTLEKANFFDRKRPTTGSGNAMEGEVVVCDARIPAEADFLIANSTVPEYCSYRHPKSGSFFVQSLCKVLDDYGDSMELIQMLTRVNKKVAYDYEIPARNGNKKQMSFLATRLTAEVFFKPKHREQTGIQATCSSTVRQTVTQYPSSNELQSSSASAKDSINAGGEYGGKQNSDDDVDLPPQPHLGVTSKQKNGTEPVERRATSDLEDEFCYKMSYPERGCFVIFNHYTFDYYNENKDKDDHLQVRKGTNKDARDLEHALKQLGFEYIKVINDATRLEIIEWIDKLSCADHSPYDCFGCAILTHGGDTDIFYSRDAEMNLKDFTRPFGADRCTSLAGKPKLFFIQACRGKNFDDGGIVPDSRTQLPLIDGLQSTSGGDAGESLLEWITIPAEADFLIANSTVPEYYSWRNESKGSYFVQSVCEILHRYGGSMELMQMMTRVNRMVAYDFESSTDDQSSNKKKQIPSIATRLTAGVYFKPKTQE